MAKTVKKFRGYFIKETTKRDEANSLYWVCLPGDHFFIDWECDTLTECIDFITGKMEDKKNGR